MPTNPITRRLLLRDRLRSNKDKVVPYGLRRLHPPERVVRIPVYDRLRAVAHRGYRAGPVGAVIIGLPGPRKRERLVYAWAVDISGGRCDSGAAPGLIEHIEDYVLVVVHICIFECGGKASLQRWLYMKAAIT